jgi:hypothetical protein
MGPKKISNKIANCIRERSNWGKLADVHKFDNAAFNPQKVQDDIAASSPKLWALIRNIRALDEEDVREHGHTFKHFIYSDVRSPYGAKLVAAALAAHGYTHAYKLGTTARGKSFILGEPAPDSFACMTTLPFFSKPVGINFRKEVLRRFNGRPDNVYGDQLRIVILDSGLREGVDLFDVKYVHLFEPILTAGDQKQAIGRATRFCGQKGLTFENGWPLHVFRYDTEELFDLFLKHSNLDTKRMALAGELEGVVIDAAVDRELTWAFNQAIAGGMGGIERIVKWDSRSKPPNMTRMQWARKVASDAARYEYNKKRERESAQREKLIAERVREFEERRQKLLEELERRRAEERRLKEEQRREREAEERRKRERLSAERREREAEEQRIRSAERREREAEERRIRSAERREREAEERRERERLSAERREREAEERREREEEQRQKRNDRIRRLKDIAKQLIAEERRLREEHERRLREEYERREGLRPPAPRPTTQSEMLEYVRKYYDMFVWPPVELENGCIPNAAAEGNILEFSPTQNFVRHFLTPVSPYRGLLAFHSVGTGKTCLAIATASTHFEPRGWTIIYVTKTTLKGDVWKNMFDQVCSVALRGVEIPKEHAKRMRMLSRSWNAIQPLSYKQFSNMLKGKSALSKKLRDINGSRDPLHKTLVIIDEAHKLFAADMPPSEKCDVRAIREAFDNSYEVSGADAVKLLLMTGTPYTSDPIDMVRLFNLMLEPGQKLPEDFGEFAGRYLDDDGKFTDAGRTQFSDEIAGMVSYLNRENDRRTFAYPIIYDIKVPMAPVESGEAKKTYDAVLAGIADIETLLTEMENGDDGVVRAQKAVDDCMAGLDEVKRCRKEAKARFTKDLTRAKRAKDDEGYARIQAAQTAAMDECGPEDCKGQKEGLRAAKAELKERIAVTKAELREVRKEGTKAKHAYAYATKRDRSQRTMIQECFEKAATEGKKEK